MKPTLPYLPWSASLTWLVTLSLVLLMAWYGPIHQPPHYHAFADSRAGLGIQNAADVLSNLGFAVAGIWGLLRLGGMQELSGARHGLRLFLIALVLTAAGSAYYHLQPDDARLVWDRIPIALACAGLLAAVHAQTGGGRWATRNTALLALAAVLSVVWWQHTADLRPYLLLQVLPLILIPLWQHLHATPRRERRAYMLAILLYVLAKLAEIGDHEILTITQTISGHTLKHLLAAIGAAVIVLQVIAPRDRRAITSRTPASLQK